MQKTGTGPKVTPTGDFISNIILEFARRIIRNGERIAFLMEELDERFGKQDAKTYYTILGELQQLGIDVSPNEWIFYTPIEYRAELLSKYLIRTGKTYGSRSEDIDECIAHCLEAQKNNNAWLKENEAARRLSPQTYYQHDTLAKGLTHKLETLKKLKNISASAVLYSKSDVLNTPLTLLGINVGDTNVWGILRTASGDIVKENADNLSVDSNKKELMQPDETEDDMLFSEFKSLALSGDPLKSLFNMFDEAEQAYPKSKEMMASYLEDFGKYIDENREGFTFSPEEITDALNQITAFAADHKLTTGLDKYKDSTIEVAARANNLDVKLADTITFFDHITDLINTLRTAGDIPKTGDSDKALNELSASLGEVKFYVKEQLQNESPAQKEAAYVVLRNIANNLQDIETSYRGMGAQEYLPYIVSSLIKSVVKKGKTMLNTLGD